MTSSGSTRAPTTRSAPPSCMHGVLRSHDPVGAEQECGPCSRSTSFCAAPWSRRRSSGRAPILTAAAHYRPPNRSRPAGMRGRSPRAEHRGDRPTSPVNAVACTAKPRQHPQGEVTHLPLCGEGIGRPTRQQQGRDLDDEHSPAAPAAAARAARDDRPGEHRQSHGTCPDHPAGGARTTMAPKGDRRPPRRRHPRRHLSPTCPLDRERKEEGSRESARAATRPSHRSRTPCVTTENAYYPALGELHPGKSRSRRRQMSYSPDCRPQPATESHHRAWPRRQAA